MTTDIAAFLNRALDEEAETARAAARGNGYEWHAGDYFAGEPGPHIARQDPQATLDRVEALRQLGSLHVPVKALDGSTVCATCTDDMGGWPSPCPTLRALASAYRRHPDYGEAWAPDGVGVDA